MDDFKLAMISAGFEHGGNVTHRHLDGHPDLLVYPFESQLGNREFNDFLSSVERVQYRYPEFPEGLTPSELYESIIDEEMKTFLRKRNGSKFREANLVLDENDRKKVFVKFLEKNSTKRAHVIEAFFRSTFEAWENKSVNIKASSIYVGYSPAICLDAPRIVKDFPNVKIIHIVRNPFSAYFDTKRRPFPQSLIRYLITWNIYHSTADMYANIFSKNFRIFRYEDLVSEKEYCMKDISDFLEVNFNECMLYPSWNGVEIKGDIAPWGTVLRGDEGYNRSLVEQLSDEETDVILKSTSALAKHFNYHEISYLKQLYS